MPSLNDAQISDAYNSVFGNRPDQGRIDTLMQSGQAEQQGSFRNYLQTGTPEGATQLYQNAIKPAVTSLESSRPEVNTAFDTRAAQVEASKNPLKERYQKIIDDIKGSTQSQVSDTTRVASQEFGKRGITGSSTFAQEEILRRTQPIEQFGVSQQKDVGFEREDKLRGLDDLITNLTQEKIAAQRDITNTIAQIQASAGKDAANAAMDMFKIQQQQRENALDRAISEKNAETARITATAPGEVKTQLVTQGGRQLLINSATGETIRDIGASGTGTGTGTNLASIFNTPAKTTTPAASKGPTPSFQISGGATKTPGNPFQNDPLFGPIYSSQQKKDPFNGALTGLKVNLPKQQTGIYNSGLNSYFSK